MNLIFGGFFLFGPTVRQLLANHHITHQQKKFHSENGRRVAIILLRKQYKPVAVSLCECTFVTDDMKNASLS